MDAMKRMLSLAAMLLFFLGPAPPSALAAGPWDGEWFGTGTAGGATCGSETFDLTVSGNQVSGHVDYRSAKSGTTYLSDVTGQIDANGAANLRLQGREHNARTSKVVGTFSGTTFTGTDSGVRCSYHVELSRQR